MAVMAEIVVWVKNHRKFCAYAVAACLVLLFAVEFGGTAWVNAREAWQARNQAAAYKAQMEKADKAHGADLKEKAQEIATLKAQREASVAVAQQATALLAGAKAKATAAEQRALVLTQQHDVLVGQLKILSDALVAARDTSNVKDENVVPGIRIWLRARAAADRQRAGGSGPITAGPGAAVRP